MYPDYFRAFSSLQYSDTPQGGSVTVKSILLLLWNRNKFSPQIFIGGIGGNAVGTLSTLPPRTLIIS